MAHGDNSESSGIWRAGSLSVEELERLAGEIRPSWEIGLDAADDAPGVAMASLPAVTPSAEGFAAAPAALRADLGAAVFASAPAAALPLESPRASQRAPAADNAARVSQPPPAIARSAPRVAPAVIDDDAPVAPRGKFPLVGLLAGGAIVLVAVLFFALRGGSENTASPGGPAAAPANTTAVVTPVADPVPVAPAALAPMPEPAAVAPTPAPVAPPAAPRPAQHASNSASTASSPAAPATHHAASTSSHPAAARRPRGVGFVTDSPY